MKTAVFFGNVISASKESGTSIGRLLEIFRGRGVSGIEICTGEYREYGKELDSAVRDGFEITSVYNEYGFQNGILDPDEVMAHIHTAVKLMCPRILIIPGFHSDTGDPGLCMKEKENFLKCIGTVSRMARDAGIVPLLENYDSGSSPVCRFSDVIWFAERIPELSVTLDVGNLLYAGENEFDAMTDLENSEKELGRELLSNVHCKDRSVSDNGYARVDTLDGRTLYPEVLGEGCIDYRWLTGRLKERGYRDNLVVENFAIRNYVDFMLRSIDNIKKMIG